MKIKENQFRFIPALFLVLLVSGGAILLLLSCLLPNGDISFDTGEAARLNEGWTLNSDGAPQNAISLPTSFSSGHIALAHTLPDTLPPDCVLRVSTAFQSLTVSVDGEVLYTFPKDISFGSLVHVIPLPETASGKSVTLEFQSLLASDAVFVDGVSYGSRSGVLFSQLWSDAGSLAVSFIILIIGLLLLATSWFFSGFKNGGYRFICLGTFSILSAVWILTDCGVLQFLPLASPFPVLLSFYSFTLIAVPIVQFMKLEGDTRYARPYDIITLLMLVNFIINVCASTVSILLLPKLLPLTHVLLLSAILLFVWTLIHQWVHCHTRRFSALSIAFFLLCVTGIVDLARFYKNPVGADNSLFFKLGLVVFITILGFSTIRESLARFRDSVHLEVYKKLAFTDTMTSLANRAAYERDLAALKESLPLKELTVIAFDLNNLKQTNDTLGHSVGDSLIIASGRCIRESFSGLGDCYRIGGDEFCILTGGLEPKALEQCLNDLESRISRYNAENSLKLDIAWGFSHGPVNCPEDLDALLRKADKNMYAYKKHCHLENT